MTTTASINRKEHPTMTTTIRWRTESVTPLPPGLSVTLSDGDGGEESTWPAIALLQQAAQDDYHGYDEQRIVLGLLNPHRGYVEPFDIDDDFDRLGEFVCINRDGQRLP
jgi:hypothetical protein